jgi:hypothetical protein
MELPLSRVMIWDLLLVKKKTTVWQNCSLIIGVINHSMSILLYQKKPPDFTWRFFML